MYPSVLDRICEMSQMRLDVCGRLPADHPFQPLVIEPLQSIPVDAEVVGEPAVPESASPEESSSSHPKPTTQTSDQTILDELANHYSGELPGFEPNLEKASELAYDEVILENPQQQEPNSEMATNTCTELIIHHEYQPYHLNGNHSNISFDIELRNIARKRSSFHEQSVSDQHFSRSEEQILSVQPISVAQPTTKTTLNPAEPEQMII